jgi:glycosyltransferase involved in cell wall biosynthesis
MNLNGHQEELATIRAIVAASGLFDIAFYARSHPHLLAEMRDPIEHYLTEGWLSGADPGPAFWTVGYLSANGDVRAAGLNPLVHYLRFGRAEGRLPMPPPKSETSNKVTPPLPAPLAWAEWKDLAAKQCPSLEPPIVEIIVSSSNDNAGLLDTVFSLLSNPQATSYRVVVATSGACAPLLCRQFDGLQALGLLDLRLGGRISDAVQPDLVLLAPGTEVFGDWLDRLRSVAMRTPHTGMIIPLSNHPGMYSYPHFEQNHLAALEIGYPALDRLASRVNANAEVEIPTGGPYCCYIRRSCLDAVGLDCTYDQLGLDLLGEFQRRAVAAGWRNVLATNVFVRCRIGGSEAQAKDKSSTKAPEPATPEQKRLVQDFRRDDPVRPYREALDLARLALRAGRGAMLFVTHRWGGGTERHVQDMRLLLEEAGVPVFVCRVDPADNRRATLEDPFTPETPNLPTFDLPHELGRFVTTLYLARITHVHIHHLAGFPENAPDFFRAACEAAGLHFDMTLHDYLPVCPRINMIDGSRVYCGEPDLHDCERCVARDGSPFGRPAVWEWRERYARLLTGARQVYVPNEDMAVRMRRFLAQITYMVRPHPERKPDTAWESHRAPFVEAKTKGIRRISLLGHIHENKGSALLVATARAALFRGLPLQFVVIGTTDREEELRAVGNVLITGLYQEVDLPSLLSDTDLVWFASVCPETYSYTLSAAFAAQTFPVAFNLGAIASRIRSARWGDLMPISWMLDPERIAEHLHRVNPATPSGSILRPTAYPDPLVSYYRLDTAFGWRPVSEGLGPAENS